MTYNVLVDRIEYFQSSGTQSNRTDSAPFLPLGQQFLVVRFLPTCLLVLYLVILPLETSCLLFVAHLFLHKILGTFFSIQACRVPFGRTLDNSAHLRERRDFAFSSVLLVMAMWIENVSHFDELEVAF